MPLQPGWGLGAVPEGEPGMGLGPGMEFWGTARGAGRCLHPPAPTMAGEQPWGSQGLCHREVAQDTGQGDSRATPWVVLKPQSPQSPLPTAQAEGTQ